MAKGYIVEEIFMTGGSIRLRDLDSGELVDVPLASKVRWSPTTDHREPKKAAAENNKPRQPEAESERRRGANTSKRPEGAIERPKPHEKVDVDKTVVSEPAPRLGAARKESKRDKSEKGTKGDRQVGKKTERTAKTDDKPPSAREDNPMRTVEGRTKLVDERQLSPEDAEAWAKMQSILQHARGRRAGKRGELGWAETTDAGRSGLVARSGQGAYKILHAGADTYALFYEWDNGRYERIACGAAEDLMNTANERARDGAPTQPLTNLSLELARLYCGTAAQRQAAGERLDPHFEEVRIGRAARAVQEPAPPEPPVPSAPLPAPEIAADPEMDRKLAESFKQALAEMEDD